MRLYERNKTERNSILNEKDGEENKKDKVLIMSEIGNYAVM
jgi:hypothetical protein